MILKRWSVILLAAIVGGVALWLYLGSAPSSDLETKGPAETTAWISLAVAMLSFLTALVGLVTKLVELAKK